MSELDQTIIGGTKTCGDWRALRGSLVPGGDAVLWRSAFDDYFQARVRLRYLEPIGVLQKHDTRQGEGFSIVAIHCTLVEFLESAVQGMTYRYVRRDADLGLHEYRKSGEVFETFLCTREPFRSVFDAILAKDFYENIRCAVLHEARTKAGWRIRADGPNGVIVDTAQRILYRNSFQEALLTFIDWYRGMVVSDLIIQQAFLRKLDSLCS